MFCGEAVYARSMSQNMRYPGTRGSVEHFFTLWYSIPSYFKVFETPEDIIGHLGALGFDMKLYRNRPSKKLAMEERYASGEKFPVGEVVRVFRVFGRDTEYTRAFFSDLKRGSLRALSHSKLRLLYRFQVEPGYAARLMNAGLSMDGIITAWRNGIAEEYATLAAA